MHSKFGYRVRAALIHLLYSMLSIVSIFIVLVLLWFPTPFLDLLNIWRLLAWIIAVNVVCGPLLTFIVWNPNKSISERWLDISIVIIIQLAALGYGLWSLAQTRPVFIVYEVDRFRAISPNEIATTLPSQANQSWNSFSLRGPKLISVREPFDNQERMDSINLSLSGSEPSTRPDWWQSYEKGRDSLQQRMHPIRNLHQRSTEKIQKKLDQSLQVIGIPMAEAFFVPLVSARNLDSWIVLLDAQAKVVGYAPVGGFE